MEPGTAVGSPCCSSIGKQRKIAKGWTRNDKRNAARALARAAVHEPPLCAAILKQICGVATSCKADIIIRVTLSNRRPLSWGQGSSRQRPGPEQVLRHSSP